jgi:outer membrane protein assembly factor BamB
VGYPTGPRASVLIREDKAYSFGTMGHLFCLDAKSGQVLWEVNTLEAFQVRLPIWGLASNPILYEETLIVQLGGEAGAGIVAFHKDTGKEVWRALNDEASYSAPVLITQAGKQVLVCWTGESITGLNPKDGEVYWSLPFQPGNMIMNIADPVYDPPYLFLSGFFDGSYLLKLDQESASAKIVYHRHGQSERKTDALHCCISTPFIHEGHVYGIDSYGEARCLDLLTGERIWEDLSLVPKARWANVHLVRQGDLTWGFNELGELLLGRFTPDGYVDLGRVKVIDPVRITPNPRNGVCWAHPAFSGRQIVIRSDEQLICIQVNNP